MYRFRHKKRPADDQPVPYMKTQFAPVYILESQAQCKSTNIVREIGSDFDFSGRQIDRT